MGTTDELHPWLADYQTVVHIGRMSFRAVPPVSLERVPAKKQRAAFSFAIAALASTLVLASAVRGSGRTDFSQTWFGASALLHGANPFALMGPGMVFDSQWGALYPATAYVIGIPFAILPEHLASALFVFLSAFALAYGATRNSWQHLPMFASVAFLSSAHLAQWSILFTAALFTPSLSIAFPAKPQMALAILAGMCSRRRVFIAAVSFAVITGTSLVLLPSWPTEWLALVRNADQLTSPLFWPGGILILAVLFRWRRAEAWLVALMAAMPQTSYPYNLLPLLAVAATYREASLLSIASSAGALLSVYVTDAIGGTIAADIAHALTIAFCYLPPVLVVLHRPNARAAEPAREFLRVGKLADSRVLRGHRRFPD